MRKLAGILLLGVLFSCEAQIERLPKPADLIPRDSMVMVLQDMMLLESHIQGRYPGVNRFYKVMERSGDTLLAKYHISFERYDRSMDYYASRQDEMQSIYTEVLDSITRETNILQAK